jgi:hypothetical protein
MHGDDMDAQHSKIRILIDTLIVFYLPTCLLQLNQN